MYSVKAVEYLIAVSFLLLFIPFWRFVNAELVPRPALVAEVPRWVGQVVDWFRVPVDVYFHPGHAWARLEDGGLVTVGMDDFAQKLVGSAVALTLPEVGSRVGQGETAWSFASDSKSVEMLSPVDGTVMAVNDRGLASPGTGTPDPYAEGWLLKVRAPRLTANVRNLLSGTLARRWMDDVSESLRARITPDLGYVYQDGGLPVEGMARSLDPDNWDEVARTFFLT
ncbi:MAG: glycine cleavage system protein H [Dehalococcoidia bacterium]